MHIRASIAWSHLADQLNETVIKRDIQHDLRVKARGRKRDSLLLEELLRLACRHAGQSPSPSQLAREVQNTLLANVGPRRVAHYLQLLAATLLVRLIRPLELRLKRQCGSSKICIADHGLRASWLHEVIPLAPDPLARARTGNAGRPSGRKRGWCNLIDDQWVGSCAPATATGRSRGRLCAHPWYTAFP